jgi:hypothetical protein
MKQKFICVCTKVFGSLILHGSAVFLTAIISVQYSEKQQDVPQKIIEMIKLNFYHFLPA